MGFIVYVYDRHDNTIPKYIPNGNWLTKTGEPNRTFCTIALDNYIKPNPNKTYIILKESVLKKAVYWAPRWNSIYTSDKYRFYYNSSKSTSENLNEWVGVYKNIYKDYNPKFTYNEIGIPQNEIVFNEPIDLRKYGEWIIL
jgi:hypothetical protein